MEQRTDDLLEHTEALVKSRVGASSINGESDTAIDDHIIVLRDLAEGLMKCSTEDSICWEIARGAIKKVGLEDCVVYLLDPSDGKLRQRAAHGPKSPIPDLVADPIEIRLGNGIVGAAASQAKTIKVDDTSKDSRYIIDDAVRLSELAVPIILNHRCIGVIDSEHPEKDFYNESHVVLLEAVASIASTRFAATDLLKKIDASQQLLARSQKEYEAIFNGSPSTLIVCDKNLLITDINDTGCDMLQIHKHAHMGHTIGTLIGAKAGNLVARHLEAQAKGETVAREDSEFSIVSRNGDRYWMCVDVATVNDSILVDCQDITSQRRLTRRLRREARLDGMTRVLNRSAFESRLAEVLEECAESASKKYYLCFVSLDRFKDLNDQWGHSVGDKVLTFVATELSRFAGGGMVGRIGGDEFAACLQVSAWEKIEDKLEELLESIRKNVWLERGSRIRCSVSIGAVGCSASKSITPTDMLIAADAACHDSKCKGRDTYTVHTDIGELVSRRSEELKATRLVKNALDFDRIVLYAQRIQGIQPGVASGHEVLVRIKQPTGEIIFPNDFIPAAERSGYAPALDLRIVELSIDWIRQHRYSLRDGEFLSINLSGHSLSNEDVLASLVDLIARNQNLARFLLFEVTETAALTDIERTRHFMEQMKQQGVRFALDDFGVGVSSLAYLKNLPVDMLKIDGGFVRDIANQRFDQAFVAAIQNLASALGILTTAEWIECDRSLEMVRLLNVDLVQGYAIGKPTPIDLLDGYKAVS